MTGRTNPPALHTWSKRLETAFMEPLPEHVTHLWEARSGQVATTMTVDAVRLAEGVAADYAAGRLRRVLEDLTNDATLSTALASIYDDSGSDWTGRGVCEHAEWNRRLETVLTEPLPEHVTHLWEAGSDQHDATMGAGAFRLAAAVDVDRAAYRLRCMLEDLTNDATLSVTVVSIYDDGGSDWTGRGVSESIEDYEDDDPEDQDAHR